jgi:hypothetical protein
MPRQHADAWWTAVPFVGACQIASGIGAWLSGVARPNPWVDETAKPWLWPPFWVFPTVWGIVTQAGGHGQVAKVGHRVLVAVFGMNRLALGKLELVRVEPDAGVAPGDQVHLEADTIGKYVRALMEEQRKR